jgi:endogenous inhibitor of DNA gyrase (YacG/DUF329 family)
MRAVSASGFKSRWSNYIGAAMATISSMPASPPRPCPICGKPAVPRYRPFCSPRCAQIDLGRWLKGNYSIPTDEAPDEGDDQDNS